MLEFLRSLLRGRKLLKEREKELEQASSALKKTDAELGRMSSALKESDDALTEVSSALQKSDDTLSARIIQRSVISELGQRALSGTDLDELMTESCFLISQMLGTEFCDIIEASEDRSSFVLRAAYGWSTSFPKNKPIKADEAGDVALTLDQQASLFYENLAAEKRFKPSSYLTEHNINSGINVVILGHDKPFGVLGAHTIRNRKFNQDEVNFLQTIANMIGAAIQRKRSETISSQLVSIVESSDNAIISTTPDGTIVSWNPSAERIFGYTEEEMKGRSISMIVPEDRLEEHTSNLQLLEKGKTAGHFETVRLKKNGEKIDVSVTASPVKNKDGDVVGMSIIARDITNEKVHAEMLRRSEVQLKAAQRIGQMGSWELDLVSNSLSWSQELYRIYGLEKNEPITLERYLSLVHPDDRQFVGRLLEARRPFTMEYRIVGPGGDIRFIYVRGEIVADADGVPNKFIGIAQDVTDRKRADEQLRSSREQLRALSAHLQFIREEERSRIAREVHDELGQVLTALKMDLSLLNHKMLESSAILPRHLLHEEIKSMSKKVDATIKSVRKIVTELRPEVLDHLGLKAAIEWQAQEFQTRSGIECKLDPRMEFIELHDRDGETAIFRILQEALTNVGRHSGASQVEIFLNKKDAELMMEVRDNGRGITDTDLSKKRSFGLLGMRERALFLGGDVEVTGSPGNGTSVKVRIPVRIVTG